MESNSREEREDGFSSEGESEAGAEEEGDLCSGEEDRDSGSSVPWRRREKRIGQESVKKMRYSSRWLITRFLIYT